MVMAATDTRTVLIARSRLRRVTMIHQNLGLNWLSRRINRMGVSPMPSCHSCNKSFESYHDLALHISTSKKGHRRGKKWAAKFLLLNGKRDRPTNKGSQGEVSQEARDSTKRELSGETENVLTICPKCKQGHREVLPVEYSQSPTAWQIKGILSVLCAAHRK